MIGNILNHRYRLDAELGRGGMGVVYRGHDLLLERDVAVKMISQAGLGTEGRVRLLREAQAVAQLNHPNIITALRRRRGRRRDLHRDGVAGRTLALRAPAAEPGRTGGDRPAGVRRAGSCPHARHHPPRPQARKRHRQRRAGPVRERRPSPPGQNRDEGLRVKLTDFGLARSVASRLTTEGGIVGTVFYLPPEQALGKELDGRADLYALGVMLYELAAGRLPYGGDDPLTVISQHLHAPVVPPTTFNPDIPRPLEALILKLMSKQPEDRPASAAEVGRILERIARKSTDILATLGVAG